MPDSPDKVNERWWARFLGGVRHPSQGTAHPDVSGSWFTVEHKYRKLEQYSAEFRKAIQQADLNKKYFPQKIPFICLTFHGSRGENARRFLIIEVYNKDTNLVSLLTSLLDKARSGGTDQGG